MAPTSPQPRRSPRRKNHSVSGAAPQPRPAPLRRTRAERKEQRAVSDTASMQEAAVDVDMAAAAAPLEPMDASLKESIAEVVALAQGAFAVQPVQAGPASRASLERRKAIPLSIAARASAQPEAQPQQQPLIADAPTSGPQTAHPNHQRTEATGLSSPPTSDTSASPMHLEPGNTHESAPIGLIHESSTAAAAVVPDLRLFHADSVSSAERRASRFYDPFNLVLNTRGPWSRDAFGRRVISEFVLHGDARAIRFILDSFPDCTLRNSWLWFEYIKGAHQRTGEFDLRIMDLFRTSGWIHVVDSYSDSKYDDEDTIKLDLFPAYQRMNAAYKQMLVPAC